MYIDVSDETELSRNVLGLFTEASHAHWTDEKLIDTLRPFVTLGTEQAGAPNRFPIAESYSTFGETIASLA